MYKTDTILVLKEEHQENDKRNTAYDKVKVLGASPVNHGVHAGTWGGQGAAGVIIQPAGEEFGGTIDEPFGKLQQLYDVEFEPGPQRLSVVREVEIIDPGPSPEQVFAAAAEEKPAKPARRRAKPPEGTPEEQLAAKNA